MAINPQRAVKLANLGLRRCVTGAALTRTSLGLAILYEYAVNYSLRHYLWGEARITRDLSVIGLFSPYQWSSGPFSFELIFHAGIFVTCLFVAGIGGRLTTIAVYMLTVSLQDLNSLITDGGDNITRIVLLYMIFADLSGRRDRDVPLAVGLLHNAAILAVAVQLSMLYLSTGLYKAMGEHWQNGVAVYYVMRVNAFAWTGIGQHIYPSMIAVVVLTYATVLFEVAFPFMLFNRWTRWFMLGAGVMFHVGLAAVMGLFGFSWMMLSLYFVLVSDREYERVKSLFSIAGSGVVLYDGMCGLCGRFVGFVMHRDKDGVFCFERLEGEAGKRLLASEGVHADRLDSIYVIDENGSLLAGSTAVIFILRCLGWPWCWIAPLGVLPRRMRDALYNCIARNRYAIGGACGLEASKHGTGRS